MILRKGDRKIARYASTFAGGQRDGHGAARSDDSLVWAGARRDEETSDAARIEGKVPPNERDARSQVNA
jgi:hypothetical protein